MKEDLQIKFNEYELRLKNDVDDQNIIAILNEALDIVKLESDQDAVDFIRPLLKFASYEIICKLYKGDFSQEWLIYSNRIKYLVL